MVCISRSIGRTSSKVILHFAEYYENTSEALCLFWAEKEMNKPESSEEGQWTGAYDIIWVRKGAKGKIQLMIFLNGWLQKIQTSEQKARAN